MKNCPHCAEEIQDEAIFCRYCKTALEPQIIPGDIRNESQSGTTDNSATGFGFVRFVAIAIFLLIGVTLILSLIG